MINLRNWRHIVIQQEVKANPILNNSQTFSRASRPLQVFTSSLERLNVFLLLEIELRLPCTFRGFLACKRCSASGLNCRYLNPYKKKKLKLIGLATRLPNILKKQNKLSNFSRLLNASARITY